MSDPLQRQKQVRPAKPVSRLCWSLMMSQLSQLISSAAVIFSLLRLATQTQRISKVPHMSIEQLMAVMSRVPLL